MICSTFIAPQQSYGQSWEQSVMDSVRKIFPHDSMYVKNEVIIKFKPHALDLSKLCYSYSTTENLSNKGKRVEGTYGLGTSLEDFLDAQRFSVEELILDSSLVARLKMYGGDSLRRITHANPCKDTLSLTRSGDTIPIVDYLYMVVLINNDTSVVELTVWPTIFHQDQIDYTEPNTTNIILDYIPNDYFYGDQTSLKPAHIDAEFAWGFERGDPSTLVAVIDDGIDYRHCDLGDGNWGPGKKVAYGRNIVDKNSNFHLSSSHGTQCAGVIGAFTNRSNCVTYPGGVAGIAGGWKNDTLDESGCTLLSYKIFPFTSNYETNAAMAMQAVMHASNKSVHSPYGQGVHVINSSFGLSQKEYSRSLLKGYEESLNSAFENQLVQVSSAGNSNTNFFRLPSTFDAHKMIRVGAYDKFKIKAEYSNFSKQIDLLAPGGQCWQPDINEALVFSTVTNPQNNLGISEWKCFDGTSAAAPHVSGAVALIHSYANKQGWTLYPEDYEGIIKAAAADVKGQRRYLNNYDSLSGWGNLDLRKIFFMFQQGYRIYHFSDENSSQYAEDTYPVHPFLINVSNSSGKSPLQAGAWEVKQRNLILHTVSHNKKWIDNGGFKIYVWGRSGPPNSKHGYGPLFPPSNDPWQDVSVLFQNGFTGVYSGYGGNYLTSNMIHDYNNSFNQTTNSHEFKLFTHQYAMRTVKGPPMTTFYPIKSKIAMHYTVFAKEIPDSTVSVYEMDNKIDLRLNNNFSNQIIVVHSDLLVQSNAIFKIYNSLGSEFYTSKNHISNKITVDISSYPSGLYFVSISDGIRTVSKQFLVQK